MNGKEGELIREYTFENDKRQILQVSFLSGGDSQKLITIKKERT